MEVPKITAGDWKRSNEALAAMGLPMEPFSVWAKRYLDIINKVLGR